MNRMTYATQQAAPAAAARVRAGSGLGDLRNAGVVTMCASATTEWFSTHVTTKRPARHLGDIST